MLSHPQGGSRRLWPVIQNSQFYRLGFTSAHAVFLAGQIFEDGVRCIAWGARLLVIGFTGGIGLARTNLLLIKGASVLGVRAGEAARKNPALGKMRIAKLREWAEQGKIHPNVSHRLPLEDYAAAMQLLVDCKAIGRVALKVTPFELFQSQLTKSRCRLCCHRCWLPRACG